MKYTNISVMFFSALLIASMYTIPQMNSVSAHESEGRWSHDACFNYTFNSVYYFLSIVGFIVEVVLLTAAFVAFFIPFVGPGIAASILASLEGIKLKFLIIKTASPLVTVPVAAAACPAEVIPPPTTVSDKVHLDCNSEEAGFKFTSIENTKTSTEEFVQSIAFPKYIDKVTPTIKQEDGPSRDLPLIFFVEPFFTNLGFLIFFGLGITIEWVLKAFKTPTQGTTGAKSAFVQKLGSGLGAALTSLVIKKIAIGATFFGLKFATNIDFFAESLQFFNYKAAIKKEKPNSAIVLHPWAEPSDAGVRADSTEFKLGKNTVTYFGNARFLDIFDTPSDTAPLPFNVYDNEPPAILFGPAKNVTVEANAHYGFKQDAKSLPHLKLGTTVSDNCSSSDKIELEYIGPKFFLLSKLKKDQYAQWKATDTAPENYHALSSNDVQEALDATNLPPSGSPQTTITARINPSQEVNIVLPDENFSTLRHIIASVGLEEINDLIITNAKQNAIPPTADIVISGELRDQITNDKISITDRPEIEQLISNVIAEQVDIAPQKLSDERATDILQTSEEDQVLFNSQPWWVGCGVAGFGAGGAGGAVLASLACESTLQDVFADIDAFLYGYERPTTLGTETARPNVYVDFQNVTVVDTIAPSILVTEDLALLVNKTHPENTNSTLLNDPKSGCSGTFPNVLCKLVIRPPAVFDIADPFPVIFENYTGNGTFNGVEGDLISDFPIGVSSIGWKAIDFSGNGNNTIVSQIVNLKFNGTNIVSNVFDVNETAFSTVPKQVTLIANNTDKDPLKFLLETNPNKGILDTPIDVTFFTKFEILGKTSKLTGIVNSPSNDEIFLTDSRNERVMKIDGDENLLEEFVGPQLGTPSGISVLNTGNTILLDNSTTKILEIDSNGDLVQTFDLTGLFKKPQNLAAVQSNNKIIVTDSEDGSISRLSDFTIFEMPGGIEFDTNSGNVIVIDRGIKTVNVFNSTGFFLESFSTKHAPIDIATDSSGNIYITEINGINGIVEKFDSNFMLVDEFGVKSNSGNFFKVPYGIAIDDSTIFITDTSEHQVQKINFSNPRISENYNDATNWLQNDTGIEIANGVVNFTDATVTTSTIKRVFSDLQTTLGDTFSAEFEIKSGVLSNNANAFIWLLTNNTKHTQNSTAQDALGVIYDDKELKIFERHGGLNTTSSAILLPNDNTDYFVSFEKLNSTLALLAVYSDIAKTNQLPMGNVTHLISSAISGLHVLQHANDIAQGNANVDLSIDDTFINPLVTWIGKCDSGPNCIGGTSNQFQCTDTRCIGSGSGSANGQFDFPSGVAVNGTHIFVSDYNNNRIQIFNASDGTHKENFAIDNPTSIEYGNFPGKRFIVTSDSLDQVKVFKSDGSSFEFGDTGPEQGNFTNPLGLAVDLTGKIYVSDAGHLSVQKFDRDGNFIQEWKSSINSRFENFLEKFEFIVPGINAGALDVKNNKVIIGDWNPDHRNIILANSHGGKITKLDLPSSIQTPHSLAFDNTARIFITDPINQNISILDGSTGALLNTIDVQDISGFNIMPTGITITSGVPNYAGENLFAYDNSTEKIFVIDESNNSAENIFNATDLYGNLNDIAFNSTHVFGLDINQEKSSIIQIRWDKGIKDKIDIGENVTGTAQGKDMDSEIVYYTSKLSDNELSSFNRTDSSITSGIINLTDFNIIPSGIGIVPNIAGLVNITVKEDSTSNLSGPRGIAITSDNKTMYVASGASDEIKGYDVETGTLIINISDENIDDPADIELLNNGTLFVASQGSNQILEVNTTSGEVSTFADSLNGISSPTGIAISPDGQKLYAAISGDNAIARYWLANQTETFTVTAIPDCVLGMSPSPSCDPSEDGQITAIELRDYITSVTSSSITNADAQFIIDSLESSIGTSNNNGVIDTIEELDELNAELSSGDGSTQTVQTATKGEFDGFFISGPNMTSLANPQDVEISLDGKLYVTSFDSNEILVCPTSGGNCLIFGEEYEFENTEKGGVLDGPASIAFSPDEKILYVSNVRTNEIFQYEIDIDPPGRFIDVLSGSETINPDGVAVGREGHVFVSNRGTNEILEYGQLKIRYYVSDWTTGGVNRIIGFDSDGNQVGLPFVPNVALTNPISIDVDERGQLWIADAGTPSKLHQINPISEDLLSTIDISNIVEEQAPRVSPLNNTSLFIDDLGNTFDSIPQNKTITVNPKGFSVGSSDDLFIADWDAHRVVAINNDGSFLGQVRLNSTFTNPLDIAVNQTQNGDINDIFVFDSNFTASNMTKLISLDINKQFQKIEFTDVLSPFLRGLDFNSSKLITTPFNSGSLFKIKSNNDANFDSEHFIVPFGIDVEGNSIFVTDWKEKRIVEMDSSLDFENEFDYKFVGFPTTNLGDIEVNANEEFFLITEPNRAVIDQLDYNGTMIKYIDVLGRYVAINAMDSDKSDNFYIVSKSDNKISKFDLRGELLDKSDTITVDLIFAPRFFNYKDITLGNDPNNTVDSLYLAINQHFFVNKGTILKYNSTDLQQIGSEIDLRTKCGQSCNPAGIAVDALGNIYISNSTMKITSLNPDGSLRDSFTIPGASGNIKDIKIDSDNNLYAADRTLHHVYKYDLSSKTFIGWLGKCDGTSDPTSCDLDGKHSRGFTCTDSSCSSTTDFPFGRDVGQFFQPRNLALDGLNNVYVSDIKLDRNQLLTGIITLDTSDEFNRGSVPRVQKFTDDGFYIQHVISDTNNTLVQGNFEWVKGMSFGNSNFYVTDVSKLHVFDVNPFSNIKFDPTTNFTTAQLTYESFADIGMTANETDSFLYKVFDGFDESSNLGNVTMTIINPDPDNDGILGDIDLSDVPSLDFESQIPQDRTRGSILDKGDNQKLTIREARDPSKGVYIQSDIRFGGGISKVGLCDNLSIIKLTPGDRLEATCIFDLTTPIGVELKDLRGAIDVTFYDKVGRTSDSRILDDDEITFFIKPFSFQSGKNIETIVQHVHFNGKDKDYNIPPNKLVKIDTAPPILDDVNCNTALPLEAEIAKGVQWTGDINDSAAIQSQFTEQFDQILKFLNFTAIDVDNGDPQETNGDEVIVTNNATNFFLYSNSTVPFENIVEFFTVDKIGNNSTCINKVLVTDKTPPELKFDSDFTNENDPDGIGIIVTSSPFAETGRAFYDLPKILDLPAKLNDITPLEVPGIVPACVQVSGSEFNVGNTTVVCSGNDLSGNDDGETFTVTVKKLPIGLTIKNVTASNENEPGLSAGDKILVEFAMPTNMPPVETTSDLNALFELTNGDFGNDVTGKFLNPSNLEITINDISPPILLETGNTTFFDLKPNPALKSASGIFENSRVNGFDNLIKLVGDFTMPAPPRIISFMANGGEDDESVEYSNGDTFTIRFSEPTNSPGIGGILTLTQVNDLFSFSHELGNDYVGVWENESTFVITVLKVRTGDTAFDPTLGSTTARVEGNIRNADSTSEKSISVSPPLSGSFSDYMVLKQIEPESSVIETLPSGISLGIEFINGTTVFFEEKDVSIINGILISEAIDVTTANRDSECLQGCTVTFYIQITDLDVTNLDILRIFHDANNDGIINNPSEIIIPVIEKINEHSIKISASINKFSSIGLGRIAEGGGSSHSAHPAFLSASLENAESRIILDRIDFNNLVEKTIIKVGDQLKVKLSLNLAGKELDHISLFTDLREFKNHIWDSEAYVRYDKGIGVSKYDPQGLFKDVDIFILKNGSNLEIEFTLTFAKPMKESDIIIRTWNTERASSETRLVKAIEVDGVSSVLQDIPTEAIKESKIDYLDFQKWAGFSNDTMSDAEILDKIGIAGKSIPEWYKKVIPKWINEGHFSLDDFVNAIKFFKNQGIIKFA